MRPEWFKDTIPLDEYIAPMVLFFQNNGIKTINSCQGGGGHHLCGKPTIDFEANSLEDIVNVYELLKKNKLDSSVKVSLVTGFFAKKFGSPASNGELPNHSWYGEVYWLWTNEGRDGRNHYIDVVYNRVIKLVDMESVKSITCDMLDWIKQGYPKIG